MNGSLSGIKKVLFVRNPVTLICARLLYLGLGIKLFLENIFLKTSEIFCLEDACS